jgi:hypothetical protein
MGWTTGRSRFDPRRGQRIFPVASVSRPALGPTQPPVQRVPRVLSPGLKRGRGVTLTTHPHVVPRSIMSRSYTPLPPSVFMACSGTGLALAIHNETFIHDIFIFPYRETQIWSRGSSVGIASDYGLDDRGSIPAGAKDFSSNLCVQTGSEAHPASCTMGAGGSFPGAKRGRGVTLTTHPNLMQRSRISTSYTSSPPKRHHGV